MKLIRIALLYTLVTALILGVAYPLAITAIAHLTMREKANGQLLTRKGEVIGSAILGQPFTGPLYFHGRPSAAGTGYDASAPSGSNARPSSKALADHVAASIQAESGGAPVPVDLVTASASGLDPDITPAAALFQVERVAHARRIDPATVRDLVLAYTQTRQFGLLGEPRVNVLRLNLALDQRSDLLRGRVGE